MCLNSLKAHLSKEKFEIWHIRIFWPVFFPVCPKYKDEDNGILIRFGLSDLDEKMSA